MNMMSRTSMTSMIGVVLIVAERLLAGGGVGDGAAALGHVGLLML